MLKKVVACVTSLALVVSSITFNPSTQKTVKAEVADPNASGWNLVWSDDFNGNSLNTSIWNRQTGGSDGGGWGNNELQFYTDRTDNSYVSDGTLKLVAKRENYGGCRFTSARLNTAGKKSFKYGKMEARIRVLGGNQDGVWPAFWMMGDDGTGWPYCGELDIMEHANGRDYVEGTIHWGENGTMNHTFWGSYVGGNYYRFTDNVNNGITAWHTYGVTWDESSIKWYVDGNVYLVGYLGSNNAYAFQKAHYFLLNLALGSNATPYTGNVAPNNSFQSATMEVDYVRAYSYNGTNGGGSDIPSGYTNCNSGNWNDVGAWRYYVGDGAAAYKDGNSLNNFSMYMKTKPGWDWGVQAKPEVTLDANAKYNYSITANSSKATGALVVNRDVNGNGVGTIINQGIVAGDNTYTGTIQTGDSPEELVFDLANIDSGTTFTIKNLSITKVVETTAQPTTAKPSDGFTMVTENQVGMWHLYAANGSWTTGAMSYKGSGNNMDLQVRVDESNGQAGSWGLQMKYPVTNLDPNKTYDVKLRYNSTAAGTMLAKIEEGGADTGSQANVATVSGNNTYTTTVSGFNQYQLVLELSGMPAGTIITPQEVSFTPRAEVTTAVQPTTQEVTTDPTSGEWVAVPGSDKYFYNNATDASIVNVQNPGFSPEEGIYATVATGISSITLNGSAYDSRYIQGAGFIAGLSKLNEGNNTFVINHAGGTTTLVIKYVKPVETTVAPTTKAPETTTAEPTTKAPETTTAEPTTVDPKTQVKVEGYQISATAEGYRVIGSVEPKINGKNVTSYGVVYAIKNIGGTTSTNVTDADMVVGSTNPYVRSYRATENALLTHQYGDSETATCFAQVMTFGKKNVKAFTTTYSTRVYAVLEDGTYVYSDTLDSNVYHIADYIYQRGLMNTLAAHNYLYNEILRVVTPDYAAVDYDWRNEVVNPGAL